MDLHIRWMIRRDMDRVQEIEQQSFSDPWTRQDFLNCLRQRNCIGMIAECGDDTLGYMIYELHDKKLRLLNIAVDPVRRNEGAGTAMVEKLTSKLSSERRSMLELSIREANLDGQLFFKHRGLRAVEIIRDPWECGQDAYRMIWRYKWSLPVHEPLKSGNRISAYLDG